MATRASVDREIDYPTSDGKPMAETELHRDNMIDLIETLKDHFAADPMVHVSGNLLLFYEEGNKRKHVSPDVFVVRGIPKEPLREYYLLWREGKSPDVVIELTSKTTRAEDQKKKLVLYRDLLKIPEYFLFDPRAEWLKPSMQGFRLTAEGYVPIEPVAGRLPSEVLGLHLERDGLVCRLFDPRSARRLLAPREQAAEAKAALFQSEAALLQSEAARLRTESENERLRQELEALRGRLPSNG
jgi:Uma2 family endonuclease